MSYTGSYHIISSSNRVLHFRRGVTNLVYTMCDVTAFLDIDLQ